MPSRVRLLVSALVGFPLSLASQGTPSRTAPPEVRTAASAERGVPPDLATINVQLLAQGATPGDAGRQLAAKAAGVRRALNALGIPHDSIVNRSRWYWWRGRIETVPQPVRYVQRQTPTRVYSEPEQDTLYRAHDAIEIRIRDLGKLGAVLDTLMGLGLTDISPVQFSATNVTAAQQQALREATVRARGQAEAMAAASGMSLGEILSLSTQADEGYGYSPFQLSGVVSRVDGGEASTVIVQPAVSVSVTVYARWALVKTP